MVHLLLNEIGVQLRYIHFAMNLILRTTIGACVIFPRNRAYSQYVLWSLNNLNLKMATFQYFLCMLPICVLNNRVMENEFPSKYESFCCNNNSSSTIWTKLKMAIIVSHRQICPLKMMMDRNYVTPAELVKQVYPIIHASIR